ncbi:hypothetical protein SS50377_24827 [Spironucleus salmonicida]|uniref:Uncharacterized protein n=1 Tax=Spironucleus salmonicida TaxID=348837 RepID=V6LVC6_9EUKA|nr:hypothetical protein SS50377_24827 [Spironucleus salmonicida]|eukprot:EST44749.1 Hypothetical protein SS50377_15371 [Spironucleus salmonicida]
MGSSPSLQDIRLHATVLKTALTQISAMHNQRCESANLKLFSSTESNFTLEMLAREAMTSSDRRDAAKIASAHAQFLQQNESLFDSKVLRPALHKSVFTILFCQERFQNKHIAEFSKILEQKFGKIQVDKEIVDPEVLGLLMREISQKDVEEFIASCKSQGRGNGGNEEEEMRKQLEMM